MAWARQRSSGKWTGYYRDQRGRERSAGTYDFEADAIKVATSQEVFLATGGTGLDPVQVATMTIQDYSTPWLRQHRVEPSTKASYESILNARILPELGDVRVSELSSRQVRAFLTTLYEARLSPATQKATRSVLSAMMQTAVADGFRDTNPCRGQRVERNSRKPLRVLTTDQFRDVYKALPSDGARLMANTVVKTGARPGEVAPLLVRDFDPAASTLTFAKALQTQKAKWNPDDPTSRYYVAPYTKTHDHRVVRIDRKLAGALSAWIESHALAEDDVIFQHRLVVPRKNRPSTTAPILTDEDRAALGTFVGPNGVSYQHATVSGYMTGRCRCDYCRATATAYKNERNRIRRHSMKDGPTRARNDDLTYVSRHRWLEIWKGACVAAELPFMPTAYQLRHTHASWLIANGEDAKTVMARLGHNDLSTTSRYVQVVSPEHDTSAAIMDDLSDWD